jgi:hypothetical protein
MTTANAYLLVQTDGHVDRLAGAIRAIPGVVFAEDVRGPYDAIALARFDAEGTTLQRMLDQVRSLPGVLHALAAPRLTHVEAVGDSRVIGSRHSHEADEFEPHVSFERDAVASRATEPSRVVRVCSMRRRISAVSRHRSGAIVGLAIDTTTSPTTSPGAA